MLTSFVVFFPSFIQSSYILQIPLKKLAIFAEIVNFTASCNFLKTQPDYRSVTSSLSSRGTREGTSGTTCTSSVQFRFVC